MALGEAVHAVQRPTTSYSVAAFSNFSRPWLALYGRRAPQRVIEVPDILLALDENSLVEIAKRIGPRALARLACTCYAMRQFVHAREDVWRHFCLEAFAHRELGKKTRELCAKLYGGCWRGMFMKRLRLRTDGLYVSRNTYIKPGTKTMDRNVDPVHLVVWFRYFRFFANGAFYSKTSPQKLRVEAKVLRDSAACARSTEVSHGGFTIDREDRVHCQVIRTTSSGSMSTTHFWTRLRQTKPGASNRIDMVKIAMVDGDNEPPSPDEDEWASIDDEEHLYRRGLGISAHKFDGTAEVRIANRGMSTLVFVPWDEVNSHEINKGVDEMDFYVTG
jgi:F-box protein 9